MIVENRIYPSMEQLARLLEPGVSGPICMVNLLKFRERAEYGDGRETQLSGREAYMLYLGAMEAIVGEAGGRFVFAGDVHGLVIGECGELWDAVGIAEYPSRAEFHRIATSPEVQQAGIHRTAGLAGQLLLLTTAGWPPP